ncbi:DUF2089 family protein [Mesoaciditoga sp.]
MAFVSRCPSCGHKMDVVALKCPVCGTGVTGKFEIDELFSLSKEQMNFVKVFLKNRGNLSEVQKELGISYPTARNRLDEIVKALGYDVKEDKIDEREVLEKLKSGEISASEAISMLRRMKKNEDE